MSVRKWPGRAEAFFCNRAEPADALTFFDTLSCQDRKKKIPVENGTQFIVKRIVVKIPRTRH